MPSIFSFFLGGIPVYPFEYGNGHLPFEDVFSSEYRDFPIVMLIFRECFRESFALKIDGWKMKFLFGMAHFQRRAARAPGSVGFLKSLRRNQGIRTVLNFRHGIHHFLSRWWQLKYFLFSPRKLGKMNPF